MYRVIQNDRLNFLRLYFLNYTWYVNDFVFQQDGTPPYWQRDVRRFLNEYLLQRWI